MGSIIKVNFIGVGGQKCASTWVYDILYGHPDVILSHEKELDFFSNLWDRGYGWYESQFMLNKGNGVMLIGEVSPSYLSDTDAPARAAEYNSNIKVIVTVRNPIDRAYSNHKHNIRHGFVVDRDWSFEKAMAENPSYVEHGFYGKHILNWLKYFPRDQIMVVFFDDIVINPHVVARDIYRFLGITDSYVSSQISKKSNESVAVANVRLAMRVDWVRKKIRYSRFSWVWDVLRYAGLRNVYRTFNMRDVNATIPKMLPSTRLQLADIYRRDIEILEKITGRNLDGWK